MNSTPAQDSTARPGDRIRRFNRFYGRRIELEYRAARVLELTAAEIRLFEVLGETEHSRTAVWLQWRTELDPGYLCRILAKFCAYGYAASHPSSLDRRSREITLTAWGRSIVRELERFHRERADALLASLPRHERKRLLHAMDVIETVLARDAMENLLEDLRMRKLRRSRRRNPRGTGPRGGGGNGPG